MLHLLTWLLSIVLPDVGGKKVQAALRKLMLYVLSQPEPIAQTSSETSSLLEKDKSHTTEVSCSDTSAGDVLLKIFISHPQWFWWEIQQVRPYVFIP